jgi:antitoxin (DNA-binding transcriptional repressor) of toxin-antitoxin stability system
MPTINMLEAKSSLSRLVQAIESGEHSEIIIARNGRPAAKLVPLVSPSDGLARLGVAKGKFIVPDSIDRHNEDVARMFIGRSD